MRAEKKKEGLIRCKAICMRWGSNRPGEPRHLINKNEIVYWPADQKLPSSLKPITRVEPAQPAQEDDKPMALSELQHQQPAQRPEGA